MRLSRWIGSLAIVAAGLIVCPNRAALAADAPAGVAATFTDASAIPSWAAADVALTAQFRVFRGDSNGRFRPGDLITRAEFTALIMRVFPLVETADASVPFTDVQGKWYEPVIAKAVRTGIIAGDDFGAEFQPNRPITRAEMARMVVRAVEARKVVFTPGAPTPFTDVPPDHPFAQAVAKATSYGIIRGMGQGTFRPSALATRAEAAVMIARAMRLGKPLDPDADEQTAAQGLNKNTKLPAYLVFVGAFELAATRDPNTPVDLTPLTRWLHPDAAAKLTSILNRDVPPGTHAPAFDWTGYPITYVGEDHALLPGKLPGVGDVVLPVQRQPDGHWVILAIPFERIDVAAMGTAEQMITFSYTDEAGTYIGYSDRDPDLYLQELFDRNWAGGCFQILRINGRPWDQTPYREQVAALHAKTPDPQPKHKWIRLNGTDLLIETAGDTVNFVAQVTKYAMWTPIILSVDGVHWGYFSESPYLRNLVYNDGRNQQLFLDEVVRANPNRYVSEFLNLLNLAKTSGVALR